MTDPVAVVTTASALAALGIALAVSGRRAECSPKHVRRAGGVGPAARRLALVRLGQLATESPPTVELILWPTVDPDRHECFRPDGERDRGAVLPPVEEDPALVLLRRVRDGLRRL
ncbi:hypothetical protein [Actinopolyspora mortivallis]|uniref:Uncharacterized protein n=1 Tax=Actinopolyspora mortivallis TaxID=33906 RepID=A0A2T0GYP9_ACTMO|nr:hypothetical protein [Actinopolyspora mortivallis]PRW64236.1 hypothetical protein CEP50_06275 [Actinopolyspora mortivallis]